MPCLFFFFFLAVLGLSCSMQDVCCIIRDLSLWLTGSLVVAWGLSYSEECGILVPRPGIEPMSPALQGRFLTTGPPGKSSFYLLIKKPVIYQELYGLKAFA